VAPTLNDLTFQYTDTGMLLNGPATPPFIDVLTITGLDMPDVKSNEVSYAEADGGYTDARFLSARTIGIQANVYDAVNNIDATLDLLKANFGPQLADQPFYLKYPNQAQRFINCKPIQFKYDYDQGRRLGIMPINVVLYAGDPRVYSPEILVSTPLPAPSGAGLAFPLVFPLDFGAASTGGTLEIVNLGNHKTYPIFVIHGPATNPIVRNNTTGEQVQFNLVLAAGDTLTIDMRLHSVLLNGTASRRGTVLGVPQWFGLQPGNNEIQFSATTSAAGTLDVRYKSAWR